MEDIFTLLFYFLIAIATINVAFYVFFLVFIFAKTKPQQPKIVPPVSVIVCAKNEEDNLKKNIPKLLEQDYPDFEIILINDASSDHTEQVMEAFKMENANVEYVNVRNNERFWGNKKYALTLGIKRARHKHLLFTDADCYPNSNQWIKQMASSFQNKKEIVLGYGAYKTIKGSLVNKLIRFETVSTALQYFSYAIAGRPYMGVGRNLAYTSDLFYDQKGFVSHIKVLSGDDDLFVNAAGTKKNTEVQFSPDSYTISEPKKTFRAWINQKRRHITTAQYYKSGDKFFLGLFYASQLLFMLLSIVCIALQYHWEWVAFMMAIRYSIAWVSVGGGCYKLGEKDIVWLFPVLEWFLVSIQLGIFITNRFSKAAPWK